MYYVGPVYTIQMGGMDVDALTSQILGIARQVTPLKAAESRTRLQMTESKISPSPTQVDELADQPIKQFFFF